MTFLQPAMLWSLAVLLPLAAIYFLKVRPRRKPTTAFFLWEKIFQERRASSLFQRLRDAWSLLLMLLVATAICLALARPEWTDERKDLILVIDTSASMATLEGSVSRLDRAKEIACEVVAGLNGTQLAAIAAIDGRLTYRSHLTENPRELIDAIEIIEPSGKSLDLGSLPGEDQSDKSDAWSRDHRVILISDGAFDGGTLPSHIELIKVGTLQDNVGLVAADLAYVPGSGNRLGFYYQVASTFAEPCEIDLTLTSLDDAGNRQLFKVIPLTIEPGTNHPETFQLEEVPSGRWLAKLEVADALECDNMVHLAALRPKPISVGVESSDPYFFEKSVQAFSRGDGLLELASPQAPDESPLPEVILAKSATPEATNSVIFQPAGDSVWWSDLGEEVEAGAPRVLVEGHPALRFLDPTSIPFVGAKRINAPTGAQILVADDSGLPLIYKARHDGRSAVVVNIDPVAADFYFSAWFPVLVHSAATHLAGRENPLAAGYRPGQAVPVPGGGEDIPTTVTATPEDKGDDEFNDKDLSNSATVHGKWYSGADKLGFYRFDNSTGHSEFGINVVNTSESLVNNAKSESRHEPLSLGRSPGQWLTLLAIVLLATESVLYHRRKVG